MARSPKSTEEKCAYVVGDDGLAAWSDVHKDAWIGLLETHKRLTRALDAELEAEFGVTLSAAEVLGRLAASPEHSLRLSALAAEAGLSLSRISRIVDNLEDRHLVVRRTADDDARAVEAHLKPGGLELIRKAQARHFAAVQERFFEQLSPQEIGTLAEVFGRFAPAAADACDAS